MTYIASNKQDLTLTKPYASRRHFVAEIAITFFEHVETRADGKNFFDVVILQDEQSKPPRIRAPLCRSFILSALVICKAMEIIGR